VHHGQGERLERLDALKRRPGAPLDAAGLDGALTGPGAEGGDRVAPAQAGEPWGLGRVMGPVRVAQTVGRCGGGWVCNLKQMVVDMC